MLARGSLGNPWRFERLLGQREGEPSAAEVTRELRWVIESAEDHLGVERAGRYLRKFYPWYADVLGLTKRAAPAARDGARHGRRPPRSGRFGGLARSRPGRLRRPPQDPLQARRSADSGCYTPASFRGGNGRVSHGEGRDPHTSGPRRAEVEDRLPLDAAPARGGRAHQGGARVRRHLGELRVRRRQERAGDAREADRRPRGEAAQRARDRRERGHERRGERGHHRAREGPEDRQVGQVHDRGLGRGQPLAEQALERVPCGPRADRQEAQRGRVRAGAARAARASSRSRRSRPDRPRGPAALPRLGSHSRGGRVPGVPRRPLRAADGAG